MKWLMLLNLNEIYMSCLPSKIDPLLIASIVSVESNGNRKASRYEDHYRWLSNVEEHALYLNISKDTEENQQKTSWGLMQLMGANARELGFKGPLTDLTHEFIGLKYGIKFMEGLFKKYGDTDLVISAYNQGSPRRKPNGDFENKEYVDKVLHRYNTITKIFN